jgi:hypothetical protein
MPTTIAEIKNLTKGSAAISDAAELAKFDSGAEFTVKITANNATAATWAGFASPNDNVQVTWKDGEKVVARGVDGRFAISGTTVTISGLTNASKFSLGLNGQIAIGPKDKEAEAALLSVRMGNIVTTQNPSGDWIIDFSDKTDGATGSEINLKVLIDWLKDTTGDTPDENLLPEMKGETGTKSKKPEDFIIEFKNFYFNITKKTFDFWVVSKDGQTVKFGNFTIKKVGFRVTNVAPREATPAIADAGGGE